MNHKIILCCALVLGGVGLAGAQLVRNLAPMPTNVPTKLQLSGVWSNVTIKLVVPGSTNPPVKCVVEEIQGKRAVYKVIPKPEPPYWSEFAILAVHDPHREMTCILAADQTFYISDKSRITGFTFYTPGIYWQPSYLVEIAETNGNLEGAIARFEKACDGRMLNDCLRQERRDNVGLQKASPLFYFLETPIGGAKRVKMKLEAFEVTDDILRLDVRNPATQKPATYWINPAQKKVVKSVVDGQEMDLNTGQPWADPLRK